MHCMKQDDVLWCQTKMLNKYSTYRPVPGTVQYGVYG
jgi:hypothetical protein